MTRSKKPRSGTPSPDYEPEQERAMRSVSTPPLTPPKDETPQQLVDRLVEENTPPQGERRALKRRLSDATIDRLARLAEDHALPLKLIRKNTVTGTVIVHDANGCAVLDTQTPLPGDDCEFDQFVVDAVNAIGPLAEEARDLREGLHDLLLRLRRGPSSDHVFKMIDALERLVER